MIEDTIEQFRNELREAVLNRKIEVKYRILNDDFYLFQMIVRLRINEKITKEKELVFTVSESNNLICYHEDLTKGIFDDDITELSKMYREKVASIEI